MNHDDPKLTAYALDSLPAADRAEIEALLKDEPSAAQEVRETKEMAGIMRHLFQSELTETLTPRRREAILQAAIGKPVALSTELPKNVIVTEASWWRRMGVWQAAAACAVFGFGVYALSVTLSGNTRTSKPIASVGDMEVSIHNLAGGSTPQGAHQPGIVTPREASPSGIPSAIAGSTPSVAPTFPSPRTNIAGSVELPNVAIVRERPQQPTMVGSDPARPFLNSGAASIGRREKPAPGTQAIADTPRVEPQNFAAAVNPAEKVLLPGDLGDVTLSADEASRYYANREYLAARWQEARSIQEGSTYADLARHFRRDGGSTQKDAHRFVMIRCPFIKVDVEFTAEDGKPVAWPVAPEARIRMVSRPYFEPEQGR